MSENCTRHTYFLRLLCDALQQREAKDVNESSFLWTKCYSRTRVLLACGVVSMAGFHLLPLGEECMCLPSVNKIKLCVSCSTTYSYSISFSASCPSSPSTVYLALIDKAECWRICQVTPFCERKLWVSSENNLNEGDPQLNTNSRIAITQLGAEWRTSNLPVNTNSPQTAKKSKNTVQCSILKWRIFFHMLLTTH